MLWDTIVRRAEMMHQALIFARVTGHEVDVPDLDEMLAERRELFDDALSAAPEDVSPEQATLRAALGLREQ